jgi:ribosomal subunit interface protein
MLPAQDVHVVVRGDVGDKAKHRAQERIAHVTRHLREPVLFARVTLAEAADPARERAALARAVLDVRGHPLRATASAPNMHEAIDRLHECLRRQLEQRTSRRKARRRQEARRPEMPVADREEPRPAPH